MAAGFYVDAHIAQNSSRRHGPLCGEVVQHGPLCKHWSAPDAKTNDVDGAAC